MSYRSEYNKIYSRINNIGKKGKDGVFDYYMLIDELIDNGQYSIFQDVLSNKYKIDLQNFKSVQDIKYKTFTTIRNNTTSSFQVELKKLFDTKNVYPIGYHFFDKSNNHFLGDIKEIEEDENWIAYKDPKLSEKEDEIRVINLEVVVGLTESTLASIPEFENDKSNTVYFATGSHVIYLGKIYGCSQSYTYNISNQITPTYSNYWTNILAPTYSYNFIQDNEMKLINKYSTAIDIVKAANYQTI